MPYRRCELNLWGIEITKFFFADFVFFQCELNLWGIEICMLTVYDMWNDYVWIEPVRDWNRVIKQNVKFSFTRVNWTCEGLKSKFLTPFFLSSSGCELNLWGIETVIFKRPAITRRKCELNLWGIETGNSCCFRRPAPRVNWTCEGLKHMSYKQMLVILKCVNWTCEGLKRAYSG